MQNYSADIDIEARSFTRSKLPSPQISSPQYFKHSDKARWSDGRDANLNSTVFY